MSEIVRFTGAEGNALVGTRVGRGAPVLLLHGGGQTRHSFEASARALADGGWLAIALDLRGHGDSDRSPSGYYRYDGFSGDIGMVAEAIRAETGLAPVLVVASLGGLTALIAIGDGAPAAALVLVDVTPTMDAAGLQAIRGFMGAHAQGFARLEDAADAIAEYLPHRPRPRSLAGLAKNLRQAEDGRWYWHWDPRLMSGPASIRTGEGRQERIWSSIRALTIPILLVRGRSSELVTEESVREFRAAAPAAEYADIAGARHMVAGDSNDAFTAAILEFLERRVGSRDDAVPELGAAENPESIA